jgi:hypothetical protein
MAEADALSQEESGVHAVLDEAVLRLAAPWLEEHADSILEAASILRASTARAEDLLSR